ncbi:MAG: hypothetical protein OXC06_15335 [Acidimicrobiaceae bacterium]|nr:hypothetical protein [Acidimicrobiaceae bacterium]
MAATHMQRLAMHARLVEIMGQEDAEALMEHLPPVAWEQMATKDDLKASELRILAELTKTNAALVETNAALVETNAALAETKVSFKEALLDTNADVVELRGEVQLGFARLERRLAWYLVAVAALLVGFGLAVWIPLVGALSDAASAGRALPAPAQPAAVSEVSELSELSQPAPG